MDSDRARRTLEYIPVPVHSNTPRPLARVVLALRDHEIRLAKAIADILRVLQRGSAAPRRTMRSDYDMNLK